MGGKSTPSTTTTIQKNEPMAELKPYFIDMNNSANDLRKSGSPDYYPKSTVVGWSQDTTNAYNKQRELANNPYADAGLTAAQNYNNTVLNGSAYYMQPIQTFERLQSSTSPRAATDTMTRLTSAGSPSNATGTLDQAMNFVNEGVGLTKGAMTTIDNGAAQRMKAQEGYTNAAIGGQTSMANKLNGATNEGTQYLRAAANGDYLNAENPYLTKYIGDVLAPLQDQFRQQTAQANGAFASSGRLGSNAYANARNTVDQTASDSMAKAATELAYNNYNAERDRQQQAQNAIGNFYNTDVGNAQAAWNSLAGTSTAQQGLRQDAIGTAGNLQNAFSGLLLNGANQVGNQQVAESGVRTDAANNRIIHDQNDRRIQLDAANALSADSLSNRNLQMNAANNQGQLNLQRQAQKMQASLNAGTLYDNLMKPINLQKGVGEALEQQAGAYLTDDINRHNANAMKDWDNLARQMQILTGGNYGMSSTTQPVYSNRGSQIAGLAGSALGAAAKMCDMRLKENIEPVGYTRTGVPLYCFTYRDDPRKELHFGPMAQEVAAIHPEAVVQTDSGYLAVRFDKLARAQRTTRGSAAVRIF